MYPILLTLGTREVRSYGVILFIAILLGIVIFWKESRRVGFSGPHLLIFFLGAVISSLLGGGFNSWLFAQGGDSLSSVLSLNAGLTSFGSIIGFLIFAVIYARWRGFNIWVFGDIAAPIFPLTEGVLRWGCLLNGCCFGRQTDSLLGIYLPDSIGYWAPRYPTQIITSAFCIGLFFWLWRKRKELLISGKLLLYYLFIYHIGRLGIDFFRGDQKFVVGYLSAHQLISIAIAAVAGYILIVLDNKARIEV
jgi:phosphatidylglycerol:prolipoprotein diacylglycerol transferase